MRTIKKNKKFDYKELYMCTTIDKFKSQYGGFGHSINSSNILIQDGYNFIGVEFDYYGNATTTYYNTSQVLSTRSEEKSSIERKSSR